MTDYRNIYAEHYGIEIPIGYVVHHIDGNRENNDIVNLLLMPARLHCKYHFYKRIVDSWGISTRLDLLYPSTYCLNAFRRFLDTCEECFYFMKVKQLMDMGESAENAGLWVTEEDKWRY